MQTKVSPSDFHALLRQDLYGFAELAFHTLNPTEIFKHNWHLEMMAAALEDCRLGRQTRLVINVPPRYLKSHLASVCFPAFLLGHDPSVKIICVSYNQQLADKHAADFRTLMTSSWYRKLFPRTRLNSNRPALEEITTTQHGSRRSTSVRGTLTGLGADILLLDDPLKPNDALMEARRTSVNQWVKHTLFTRLNDKIHGCIILVTQRLHEDDLAGHVLSMGWNKLIFPAIAEADEVHVIRTVYGIRRFERRAGEALHPEREPLETLNQRRIELGEYNFSAQYQQAPSPLTGGLMKIEWFLRYTMENKPAQFDMVFQSWDTANKKGEDNDYSVCLTFGVKDKYVYLLHVLRTSLNYPELKRTVREQAEIFNPKTILIEDRASGTPLIQDLLSEGLHPVKAYRSSLDKFTRMNSVTAMVQSGFVYVPETAPWLAEFLHELLTFPKCKKDDQADAFSQALDWFKTTSRTQVPWIETIRLNNEERMWQKLW